MPQAKDVSFTVVDYVGAGAAESAAPELASPLLRVLTDGRHKPSRDWLSADDAEYERSVPKLSRGIQFGLLFVAPFWAAIAVLLWWLL